MSVRGQRGRPRGLRLSGWGLRALGAILGRPLLARMLAAHALSPLRTSISPAAPRRGLSLRVRTLPATAAPAPGPTSARELVRAYRCGTSPREVIERALEAAAELDRGELPLRAFVHLDAGSVRAQADASARRWRAGHPLGPLDGVPIAVKDEIDVAGAPSRCGTSFLGRSPASADAELVARLRRAGAVIFGKTHMPELGLSPSGVSPVYGTARSPLDPRRETGGSSSGSAVAVAAGVVPLALGTDSGGSLRVPASLCGLVTLKPSFGALPAAGIGSPFVSTMCPGVLTSSFGDLVVAMRALAAPLSPPRVGPRLRVGLDERALEGARPDVAAAVLAALGRLGPSVELSGVELPDADVVLALGLAVLGGEAADAVGPALSSRLGTAAAATIALARAAPPGAQADARRARSELAAALARAFGDVDVIVGPTTAITAPLHGRDDGGAMDQALARALTASTLPASLAGLPAAQVPCGHDADGLPIGVQVVASAGADVIALSVAERLGRHVPWRRPRVHADLLGNRARYGLGTHPAPRAGHAVR